MFSVKDWLALIPPTVVVGGISYYSYQTIKKAREAGSGQINPCIRKDINKVVDFIDIEDITEKASLCRCWRSKNVSIIYFLKNPHKLGIYYICYVVSIILDGYIICFNIYFITTSKFN